MAAEINQDRRRFLLRAGAAIAASQLNIIGAAAFSLFGESTLPSLGGATAYQFTPAIFISSWDRQRAKHLCDSVYASTGSYRASLMALISTSKGMGW